MFSQTCFARTSSYSDADGRVSAHRPGRCEQRPQMSPPRRGHITLLLSGGRESGSKWGSHRVHHSIGRLMSPARCHSAYFTEPAVLCDIFPPKLHCLLQELVVYCTRSSQSLAQDHEQNWKRSGRSDHVARELRLARNQRHTTITFWLKMMCTQLQASLLQHSFPQASPSAIQSHLNWRSPVRLYLCCCL